MCSDFRFIGLMSHSIKILLKIIQRTSYKFRVLGMKECDFAAKIGTEKLIIVYSVELYNLPPTKYWWWSDVIGMFR